MIWLTTSLHRVEVVEDEIIEYLTSKLKSQTLARPFHVPSLQERKVSSFPHCSRMVALITEENKSNTGPTEISKDRTIFSRPPAVVCHLHYSATGDPSDMWKHLRDSLKILNLDTHHLTNRLPTMKHTWLGRWSIVSFPMTVVRFVSGCSMTLLNLALWCNMLSWRFEESRNQYLMELE